MAQVSMTVRMDEQLKKNLDSLCSQFGMSANAAMNSFAKAVVMYRRIPFEIKAPEEPVSTSGLEAFYALREEAKRNIHIREEDLTVTPNVETLAAIEEAKKGLFAGTVNTSSVDAMIKSIEE